MALHFVTPTATKLYRKQLMSLLDEGQDVHVRGYDTLEHLDVITEIINPLEHVICVPGRMWNPWIALSEAIWILAGRRDTDALKPYNSRILDFSDDGSSLYGAYGWRLKNQIPQIITRLRQDKSDRRAVALIWREEDLWAVTKDPPCNDMVMFKIRSKDGMDYLHMTVINRSNDIHWGLYAVNLPTFGIIQEYLAKLLGVSVGHQTHISNSLHVYQTKEADLITTRMCQRIEDLPTIPNHYGLFSHVPKTPVLDWKLFSAECNALLWATLKNPFPYENDKCPFLEFVWDFLRIYREKDWKELENVRHKEYYQDWIFAANYWLEERTRYRRLSDGGNA